MTLVKRLVLAAATAVVAGPLTVVPAAHASGSYVCAQGERLWLGGTVGYRVRGAGCTGSGDGGSAVVTLLSGPFADSYLCQTAQFTPQTGRVVAERC